MNRPKFGDIETYRTPKSTEFCDEFLELLRKYHDVSPAELGTAVRQTVSVHSNDAYDITGMINFIDEVKKASVADTLASSIIANVLGAT